MKNIVTLCVIALVLFLAGCAGNKEIFRSTSGKNVDADGFLSIGKIETANPETGTPSGEFIFGRITYKSRRVGIPADQKVPNTGHFRSTETTSAFGTKEKIVEYDFTAGSDADAERAFKEFERLKAEAAEKKETNP